MRWNGTSLSNKFLSLLFWGFLIGDLIALTAVYWPEGRHVVQRVAEIPNTRPLLYFAIGAAVLAVAFQPDKTIGAGSKGMSIGRAPLDLPQDWVFFGVCAIISYCGARLAFAFM
jgi:hypothetical protein